MSAEEATKYLLDKIKRPYCDNCDTSNDEDGYNRCEDCHRKMMGWRMDKDLAFEIMTEILK